MSQAQVGNQDNNSSEDFFLVIGVAIAAGIAMFFFYKEIIIAYWRVLNLLWFWLLHAIDNNSQTAAAFRNLKAFSVGNMSWKDVNEFNHAINTYLSIGSVQVFPIFWAILPALVAYPLRNNGKSLRKTFPKPWDLALYMSAHFPWMLPVIRERGKILKSGFKKKAGKKTSLADQLNSITQREKNSDWALHPLTILIKIGAFQRATEGEKGAMPTKSYGFWKISDSAVSAWTTKQLGAKAGRDGFSTPERNALFHAFVAKSPISVLKGLAAGGDKAIQKYQNLPSQEVEKFKSYKKNHAYESTILLSALAEARRQGLLPPRWFVWLKYRDRALWYALHGLGMPRPHSEGLPGLVQWHCERKQKGPVEVPQSQFVKTGLVDAMNEMLWENSKEWKSFVKDNGK